MLVLTEAYLTSCQGDTEGIEDKIIKSNITEAIETSDISIGEDIFIPKLLMETDKPFVLAEKNYIVEKQDVDVSVFNEYGLTSNVVDGKYYYTESALSKNYYIVSGQEPIEQASIYVYDPESGECETLVSEPPEADNIGIMYSIGEIYGSYIYYYKEKTEWEIITSRELIRLN